MLRVGQAARSMVERSFHTTSVNGPFGAAAATSKILQHDADTVVNALGIAASQAGGISEYTISGGSVKRLHSGFPAYAGVKAALLAQGGITGPVNAIEGKKGFCQAFANETHLEDITAGLGREFRIMWTGNKIYCCCAAQHTAIDATRAIMDAHAFQARDVDEIIIEQMPREVKSVGNIIVPEDITAAQFSGRFGVAMRLVKGSNGFDDYTLANIKDPEILELARKTRYETNEQLAEKVSEAAPAVVTIRLKNGDVLKKRIDYAKGTIQNPLTAQELEDKFRGLASLSVPGQRVEEIVAMIDQLEDVTDIGKLVSLLVIPDCDK
jgi:2-methylcitrate dehydratase PrpD